MAVQVVDTEMSVETRISAAPAVPTLRSVEAVAATIAVSIGPWLPASADPQAREAIREVREQWRQGPCQRAKRLLCVDLGEETDEAEMKRSLQAAIVHAVARLNAVRATTQRGR